MRESSVLSVLPTNSSVFASVLSLCTIIINTGSHHYGTWDFDEIGIKAKTGIEDQSNPYVFNDFYGKEIERLVEQAGLEVTAAEDMKYGQTLIWAAALIHGGMPVKDKSSSRLSQVTHYFFEGADFYWVPRLSDISRGHIYIKPEGIHRCKVNDYAPKLLHSCADQQKEMWLKNKVKSYF